MLVHALYVAAHNSQLLPPTTLRDQFSGAVHPFLMGENPSNEGKSSL